MKKIKLIWFLFGCLIVLFNINCQKEYSCTNCADTNKPPTAVAGADQVITFPLNSVSLDGRSSTDPDGTITRWSWTKISGPSSFTIAASTAAQTTVTNLVAGIYMFELVVTDNGGLSDKDTMQVNVNPATNQPPVANAGPDKIINLPVNTITLDGSGSSDPDNIISSFQWTIIAGPSSFTIATPAAVQTTVTNLVEGIYKFELKVTDAGGLSDTDTSMVEVKPDSPQVDVYVAGGDGAPKYWKNGQEVLLYGDLPGDDLASSIAVIGNDVYVAGDDNEFFNSTTSPRYWKNGQEVRLTNGRTYAVTTSIAVTGNDVYVAGWEYGGSNSLAVYWKNGQKVGLTNSVNDGGATCIAIVGNDVYVSGYESNGSGGFHVAKYWKNGQPVVLTNGMYSAFATSIAVVGNDVYVSGYIDNGSKFVACYWKNGQKVVLTNGMNDGLTTSIAVVGNDVYVTGHEGNNGTTNFVAKYWKNGQEFSLPNGRFATSIAIYDSDVYIAGYSFGYNAGARYWKNGQEVMLPNGVYATSIGVVRR